VHVFLVNGLDPLHVGNLPGVGTYIRDLGFQHTSCRELLCWWNLKTEIRQIRQEDPQARLVLIGYSMGGSVVHWMAHHLSDEDIPVDLVVYLDAPSICNMFHTQPDLVRRSVSLHSHGIVFRGRALDWADDQEVSCMHLSAPTHQLTLETLARELTAVGATVNPTEAPAVGAASAPSADSRSVSNRFGTE
jgi:hypothetical protein